MSCERKNSNDEFLETNKINTRLSIDYNNEIYSQETVKNLQKIKSMLLPEFNIIIDDIAVDIIKYCQTLIELSYQFSKANINEIVYNTKSIEIYNAIKGLIDDKSHIKLSFNPNDVLCKNDYF